MGQIDPLAVAIGAAVRSALAEAGHTFTWAGEQAGFSWQTFSRSINGRRAFTFPELVRIAAVAGTTAAEIVERAERIHERRAA